MDIIAIVQEQNNIVNPIWGIKQSKDPRNGPQALFFAFVLFLFQDDQSGKQNKNLKIKIKENKRIKILWIIEDKVFIKENGKHFMVQGTWELITFFIET